MEVVDLKNEVLEKEAKRKSLMGPRWKGKNSKASAAAVPMSEIVSQLRLSLISSGACGLLSGCSVLVKVGMEQTDLLNRACFGRPIVTAWEGGQWFQLGLEEAYYLHHNLSCLEIKGEEGCSMQCGEVWRCVKSRWGSFPFLHKAYAHLRAKNWVVRSGCQYGVDYMAYRHHPAVVHSEYAVVVLRGGIDGRLRVWSDVHCTVRLCGGVAKTLLVLEINGNGYDARCPLDLERWTVEEYTITRWCPEKCREDPPATENDKE